ARSITTNVGIELAEYFDDTSVFESSHTGIASWFCFTKPLTVACGSPTLTATTASPLAASSRWSLAIVRSSRRQGPHHVAQKSSSTTLPLSALSRCLRPLRSESVKSCAGLPTSGDTDSVIPGCWNRSTRDTPCGGRNVNSVSGSCLPMSSLRNVVTV